MPEFHAESPEIGATILARLAAIERAESVRLLYACESGSRAWGFASPDSDYDVRFLYVRPRDWYLSIDLERRRDAIERPVEGALDISGWDLRKTL
jgi:predicted nucleotidyltransferase